MTEKRFIITQDGDNFTVNDTVKKRHMGMFEFKQDEFPVYFCFHKIIDLLNQLYEENQALKSDRARYEEECRLDVFKELSEENEQLRKDIEYYKIERKALFEYIDKKDDLKLELKVEK